MTREVERGTASFERESPSPMTMTDVLYVTGLRKNLKLVSTIEDRGFEVLLRHGKVLIYPKVHSITSYKVIGIKHGKFYRLMF